MRKFARKLAQLERITGIRGPREIPLEECMHAYIHREDEPIEEINQQIEKKKAELINKYGRRILKKLNFSVVHIVNSRHPMADDLKLKNGCER